MTKRKKPRKFMVLKINEVKFMGLHSQVKLECGCILRRYSSGLNVIDDPQCKEHEGFREYECRICGKKFTGKRTMRKHRWDHAI